MAAFSILLDMIARARALQGRNFAPRSVFTNITVTCSLKAPGIQLQFDHRYDVGRRPPNGAKPKAERKPAIGELTAFGLHHVEDCVYDLFLNRDELESRFQQCHFWF